MSPQILSNNQVNPLDDENSVFRDPSKLKLPPTLEDMKQMAFIFANISAVLDSSPEKALSIASKEMGWLFARDLPKYPMILL